MDIKCLLYTVIAVAVLGCTSTEDSDFGNIGPRGWAYGDTLSFVVQSEGWDRVMSDTTHVKNGDLSVVVRHNNSYPYSNLWLEIGYMGADSIMTDTVNIQLADEFGGWLGSGVGMSFQEETVVLSDIDIDVSTPVKITHIMRNDTLPDIEQVGVVFKY